MKTQNRQTNSYEKANGAPFPQLLTRREIETLNWVAAGKSNEEQAIILGISAQTVSYHLKNIFQKLDVRTRAAAVQVATSMGLLTAQGSDSKKRVESVYENFTAGCLDPLEHILGDETEWISTAPQHLFPHAGLFRGKSEIIGQVIKVGKLYETISFLPRIFVEEAGQVAVYLDVGLINKKTNNKMYFDVAHFWTFKGRTLARYVEVFNSASAHLQQIGSDTVFSTTR